MAAPSLFRQAAPRQAVFRMAAPPLFRQAEHPRLAVFRMAVPSLFRQAVPPAEKVARDAGGIFKLPRHLKFRKMLIAELQHFGNSLFKSGAAA